MAIHFVYLFIHTNKIHTQNQIIQTHKTRLHLNPHTHTRVRVYYQRTRVYVWFYSKYMFVCVCVCVFISNWSRPSLIRRTSNLHNMELAFVEIIYGILLELTIVID